MSAANAAYDHLSTELVRPALPQRQDRGRQGAEASFAPFVGVLFLTA